MTLNGEIMGFLIVYILFEFFDDRDHGDDIFSEILPRRPT